MLNFVPTGRLVALVFLSGALASSAPALTIIPTFGSTGSAGAFSAQDIACINSVISLYEGTFSDPIAINIRVNNDSSGVAGSAPTAWQDDYSTPRNYLLSDAKTVDDFSSLPRLTASPENGYYSRLIFTQAQAKALGYDPSLFAAQDEGSISINASACFNVHTTTAAMNNPTKYDMFGVFANQLDEVLGMASTITQEELTVADLFRYEGDGTGLLTGERCYDARTNVHAWFSIDGATAINEYNQFNHQQGDWNAWGDWVTHSPGEVQDYALPTGQLLDPGVELRVLDVIGYDRVAAPEPSTWAAMGLGALVLFRRRKAQSPQSLTERGATSARSSPSCVRMPQQLSASCLSIEQRHGLLRL